MPATSTRKRLYLLLGGIAAVGAAAAGFVTLRGASVDIDPSKLATVERGTMVRSVVATGKVEPITKIEIKSKANGIIKALAGERRQRGGGRRRACRARQGPAARAAARSRCQPARSPRRARRRRGPGEEEHRRSGRTRRRVCEARVRTGAARCSISISSRSPRSTMHTVRWTWRKTSGAPRSRSWSSARRGVRSAGAGRPGQGRGGSRGGRPRQRHDPCADPRDRAHERRRARQPGLLHPQSRRERDARDDARRYRPGLRARQGGRGGHRPRADWDRPRGSGSKRSATRCSTAR